MTPYVNSGVDICKEFFAGSQEFTRIFQVFLGYYTKCSGISGILKKKLNFFRSFRSFYEFSVISGTITEFQEFRRKNEFQEFIGIFPKF
jgi:hypothetical protein